MLSEQANRYLYTMHSAINLSFTGLVVLLAGLMAGACSGLRGVELTTQYRPAGLDTAQAVRIDFLGVACLRVQWPYAATLTDPFFSNPSLLKTGMGKLQTDTLAVRRWLPDVSRVQAVLVGHSHYDHVMDLPYIARTFLPAAARVYGSQTTVNLLAPEQLTQPVLGLDSLLGSPGSGVNWQWAADSSQRILGLYSTHAPHIMGKKLYACTLDEPLHTPADKAKQYCEGQTMSFVVDYLRPEDRTRVAFRWVFMDSSSGQPNGFLPTLPTTDQAPADVLVLSAALWSHVKGYPEPLLHHLKPRTVIVCHWENFFGPRTADTRKLKVVSMTDLRLFISKVKAAVGPTVPVLIPTPGTSLWFETH